MNNIGKILNVKELAKYQDSSIVSKALIDKKVGTVSIFAFGAGEGLSEHTGTWRTGPKKSQDGLNRWYGLNKKEIAIVEQFGVRNK